MFLQTGTRILEKNGKNHGLSKYLILFYVFYCVIIQIPIIHNFSNVPTEQILDYLLYVAK